MQPSLSTAANGRLTLDFNEVPHEYWQSVVKRLTKELGFKQTGLPVLGVNEEIHPSFEREDLTLSSGWDCWSGHYLLSESPAGDDFLRKLFNELPLN